MKDKLFYLLFAQKSPVNTEDTSYSLPFTFEGIGKKLKNYVIYGNENGVGDYDSNTGKYLIPVTINGDTVVTISLDSPLLDGEYIDFKEQKRYGSGGTSTEVLLPVITTVTGINVIDIDTTVSPLKVVVQGDIDVSKLLHIEIEGIDYVGKLKVIDGKPIFELYND